LERRREGAIVLSASLAVQARAFEPAQAAPFFEGLLPEGAIREVIARSFHLSAEDGFGLLEALGADCAGAVAVLAPGSRPASAGGGRLRPLDEQELRHLIDELPRNPLGVNPNADSARLSLGGVQHKLVLAGPGPRQLSQPLDGAPSTCLLKPEFGQYEDLVANEAFCMKVAATSGLRVANVEPIAIGPVPCLYVERFDRVRDEGRVVRIHQEDTCQALGLLPAAKYEENGGPSIVAIVELLRRLRSRYMARDINDFVHAALVNFLLGNSDAHGKNFALLHEGGVEPRLAPLYDIVSTSVYPDVTERMAMAIGGSDDPADINLEAWRRLSGECGFGGGMATLVQRRAATILRFAELERSNAENRGWHRPIIDKIVEVCRQRAGHLIDAR
jgi:serine/threonine-protein kinase HipA